MRKQFVKRGVNKIRRAKSVKSGVIIILIKELGESLYKIMRRRKNKKK